MDASQHLRSLAALDQGARQAADTMPLIARILATWRDSLLLSGFTRDEAMLLVQDYLDSWLEQREL